MTQLQHDYQGATIDTDASEYLSLHTLTLPGVTCDALLGRCAQADVIFKRVGDGGLYRSTTPILFAGRYALHQLHRYASIRCAMWLFDVVVVLLADSDGRRVTYDQAPIASAKLTSVIPPQLRVLGVTRLVANEISHVHLDATDGNVPENTRVTLKLRHCDRTGVVDIQLHKWRDWRVSARFVRYQHYSFSLQVWQTRRSGCLSPMC